MKRWYYHLRVMGCDTIWIPLAVSSGYVGLITIGGDSIHNPSALILWSELILPAISALLAGLASSSHQDSLRPLVVSCSTPAWRTYLERGLLLLGFDLLLSLGAGWAITALVIPAEEFRLSIQTALASLPVLLVFSFLALYIAERIRSGPGGAVIAVGIWLFFLLNRELAHGMPWIIVYPFLMYVDNLSDLWFWNRLILFVIGISLLMLYTFSLHKNTGGMDRQGS